MSLQKCLLPLVTLILLPGAIVIGQQPQTPPTESPRTDLSKPRGARGSHMHRAGLRRWGRDLNLTEEQQQQLRSIVQRRSDATKAQREELFALREKRRASTLTAED